MDLKSFLTTYVDARPGEPLDKLISELKVALSELAALGAVPLGQDKDLTGESLEVRVAMLLRTAGFAVRKGRPGMEDLVVVAPPNSLHARPIVIEVKSDRKPTIQRQDLRQLDDWVFELSQEDVARKHGLGGAVDALAIATIGLTVSKKWHPTPHKGVLIFNGPVGKPFGDRHGSPLADDLLAFAVRRNFCVVTFGRFVRDISAIEGDATSRHQLWTEWQETEGLLG